MAGMKLINTNDRKTIAKNGIATPIVTTSQHRQWRLEASSKSRI
jgi:hypothetical protein